MWNGDITDWNNKDRAAFQAMSFSLDGVPMQPNHKEEIYQRMMAYDTHPDELLHPIPLYYSTRIDISQITKEVGNELTLKLNAGEKMASTISVPVVFDETRCRY